MGEALRSGSVESISDTMEKPLSDDRSYRVIRLPANQLEILLIHDPDTDKAAAAMDVNVGSLSDPDDLPGTAHAVEHCCFMGTKKVSDRHTDLSDTQITQQRMDETHTDTLLCLVSRRGRI